MAKNWYVASILSGLYGLADASLRAQGFETWAPTELRTRAARGVRVQRPEPLFKGYIFVRLDLAADRWRAVNGTRGVGKLLPLGLEIPLPLPAGFVEAAQARLAAGADLDGWLERIALGAELEITGGALRGDGAVEAARRVGRFLGIERGRVILLVSILGRDVKVKLAPLNISPPSGDYFGAPA